MNSTNGTPLSLDHYRRIRNRPQGTWALGRTLLSRSPGEIRIVITLVFFPLLHGCYKGFPLQGLRQIVLFPWLRRYVTHTWVSFGRQRLC